MDIEQKLQQALNRALQRRSIEIRGTVSQINLDALCQEMIEHLQMERDAIERANRLIYGD